MRTWLGAPDSPTAATAHGPAATHPLLRLQRAAGNRAVVSLLQRTAAPERTAAPPPLLLQRTAARAPAPVLLQRDGPGTETSDPRLGYQDDNSEENRDGQPLDKQRLPYNDPANPMNGWDGPGILSRWTQLDSSDITSTDPVRCGANAALSIAIAAGPRDTVRFAARVADQAAAPPSAAANAAAGGGQAAAAVRAGDVALARLEASTSADVLTWGVGTFENLSEIADAAKIIMTRDPSGMSNGYEAVAMAQQAGATVALGSTIASRDAFMAQLGLLAPGQAYIFNINPDTLAAGTASSTSQDHHFVTVGRERSDEVSYYLYDPWPEAGSQYQHMDDAHFWPHFETEDGRWKDVILDSRTSAPAG